MSLSMGASEASGFRTVMSRVNSLLKLDWIKIVHSNKLLKKVYQDKRKPGQRAPYKRVAKDLLRFMRHFYVHGAEQSIKNGVQMMTSTDDLDYMAAHHFLASLEIYCFFSFAVGYVWKALKGLERIYSLRSVKGKHL